MTTQKGAYHGMTERNPDDTPLGPQEAILNDICDDCVNINHCAKGNELEQCLAEMEREKREDERFANIQVSIVKITKSLEDYRGSRPKDEYETSLELALTALHNAIRVGGAK